MQQRKNMGEYTDIILQVLAIGFIFWFREMFHEISYLAVT